jgi:non-specific serine/threonine protein kinase
MFRPLLSEGRYEAIHAEGATLTLTQAATFALALAEQPATEPREHSHMPPPPREDVAPTEQAPSPLTRRQQEIAALLARGYTDRQIADTLFVSVGTVGWHVHHILEKLDLQSRHQVAAWLSAQEPDSPTALPTDLTHSPYKPVQNP